MQELLELLFATKNSIQTIGFASSSEQCLLRITRKLDNNRYLLVYFNSQPCLCEHSKLTEEREINIYPQLAFEGVEPNVPDDISDIFKGSGSAREVCR